MEIQQIPVYDLLRAAQETPFSCDMANNAVAVAEARNQNPFNIVWVRGVQLTQWQAIVFEALALRNIRALWFQ